MLPRHNSLLKHGCLINLSSSAITTSPHPPPAMPSTQEKPNAAKANRAISSRKRKAGDDDGAIAITSTEKAGYSITITPPEPRGRTELDSRPFQYAQIHAASANPNTQLPSDQPSNPVKMVSSSSGNPTSASSASQPKATGIPTRTKSKTTQDQTSTPERHQVLRDLFRTRSNQSQQQYDTTTRPRSASSNSKTPQPSTPTSPKEELLEEIDLRSPHDDPDYDIISPHEAVHSSHNAQADHASKYPKPKRRTHRSSSSTLVYSPSARKGFESDDSSEGESDEEFTSWRSYDFVRKTEAKHSARNAQADRASKYPELRAEGGSKGGGGGGGEEKGKGWLDWLLS